MSKYDEELDVILCNSKYVFDYVSQQKEYLTRKMKDISDSVQEAWACVASLYEGIPEKEGLREAFEEAYGGTILPEYGELNATLNSLVADLQDTRVILNDDSKVKAEFTIGTEYCGECPFLGLADISPGITDSCCSLFNITLGKAPNDISVTKRHAVCKHRLGNLNRKKREVK